MAQRILGLDLGAHAVKAVLLESAYRGFTVVGAARAPVAPGDAPLRDRQVAALGALLAERGWQPDVAAVAFPGAAVSSNVVSLPFSDARRIEQTVAFEVEGQIPFELSEVAWDWQPLTVKEGRADLLVGVVRKEELAGLLAALTGAGLDPRTVIPAGPAYAALAAGGALAGSPAAEPGAPAAAEAIVDVGQERTSVCIVAGGVCEAARTFPVGAAHLARAVAREVGIAEADAALVLEAEGGGAALPERLSAVPADPRAADALRRGLVPLVREVRATVRAWEARVGQRPLDRIVVAGEAARLPGLPDALAPEAGGRAAPIALAGPAAGAIAPEDAPAFALALALAVRSLPGARAPRLNLRRGDLAYVKDFQHLKGKITRLGAWVGLILLLAVVSSGVRVFALARQEASLDRALCDAEQKIVGRCFDNYETAVAVLRGRGTPTASLPKASAVDVFAELADRVPHDIPLKLERIEISREKLHLQGTTDAAENVDKVVTALRRGRCFGDARSGGARRRSSDGKFEFTIDSALTCVEAGGRT